MTGRSDRMTARRRRCRQSDPVTGGSGSLLHGQSRRSSSQAPIFTLQLLIDGLLIGAIFALAAYGMALVWGVMNIINIAQGEFVMLGGYVAYVCATRHPPAFRHSGRRGRALRPRLGALSRS